VTSSRRSASTSSAGAAFAHFLVGDRAGVRRGRDVSLHAFTYAVWVCRQSPCFHILLLRPCVSFPVVQWLHPLVGTLSCVCVWPTPPCTTSVFVLSIYCRRSTRTCLAGRKYVVTGLWLGFARTVHAGPDGPRINNSSSHGLLSLRRGSSAHMMSATRSLHLAVFHDDCHRRLDSRGNFLVRSPSQLQ